MGLDISHSIAIRKRPATTDPDRWGTVTEEDYAGFNVDFNHNIVVRSYQMKKEK